MAKNESVIGQLKAEDRMFWVRRINKPLESGECVYDERFYTETDENSAIIRRLCVESKRRTIMFDKQGDTAYTDNKLIILIKIIKRGEFYEKKQKGYKSDCCSDDHGFVYGGVGRMWCFG